MLEKDDQRQRVVAPLAHHVASRVLDPIERGASTNPALRDTRNRSSGRQETRYSFHQQGALSPRRYGVRDAAGFGQMQRRRAGVGSRVSPLSLLLVEHCERRDRNAYKGGVRRAVVRRLLCHDRDRQLAGVPDDFLGVGGRRQHRPSGSRAREQREQLGAPRAGATFRGKRWRAGPDERVAEVVARNRR